MSGTESEKNAWKSLSGPGKVFAGILGMFFLFGDRALREFWHMSFWGSLIVWAGALGVVVIGALIYFHLRKD